MKWTNDQYKAITTRGGKVLVSAAAGSGKTAVLSQRVLDFVLNGGNIDKLLVVTFTDAAALEMKLRIKKKIEEESLKNASEHLIRQLTLIDNAKIATMDSFYSKLVKQNFDILGIMPDFSILPSAEEKILKEKVVREILEESFDDDNYIKMLHTLNATDNNLIKDKVIKISNFLSTIPFYQDYIKEVVDNYSSGYYKTTFINSIKDKMMSYNNLYTDIKDELFHASSDFDKLNDIINSEAMLINQLLNVENFDELSTLLRTFKFERQPSIRGHSEDYVFNKYKSIRSAFKNEIQKNLKETSYITDSLFDNQMHIMKNTLLCLFNIVIKFRNKLLEEKKKINKYSFGDIPLFVIDLLIKNGKKTDLAIKISKTFEEILIDEYQDTNKLQSIIFNAISRDEKNLFLVGDIKQSIYRFRSACPDIFNNDKNNSYKDKFPMLITLSQNFRSKDLVLDFCNFIFNSTMSNYLGEVDYNDDEKLYKGAEFPSDSNAIPEIDIICNEDKSEGEEDELNKIEKEAIHVADKVKHLLDSKYQVYDKDGFYRDIKPSDIALLFRSLSHSDVYRNALINRNIGVYCNKDQTFFDNYDVMLIISILKVVDNVYDDISLAAVLKSNIFNVSDNDLATIKMDNKYDYLYDAIIKSDNEKLKKIIDIIIDLKNYSNTNSLVNTMNYIYNKLSIIKNIGLNKNKIKNLTLMIKNAKDFDINNSKSLHEFVSYIEEILLDKSSFNGANPLSDGDNVLMTTIHKSKGLEYPVVFVCETGKNFNEQDLKEDMLIDSNLGIAFNITDYKRKFRYETIPMIVLKKKIRLLQLSEELRVLYVALTRAREKLIITGFVNNLTKLVKEASYLIGDANNVDCLYLENSKSYLKWIIGCLLKHKNGAKLRDLSNIDCKTYLDDSVFKLNIINANSIKEESLQEKKEINSINDEITINNYDSSLSLVPEHLSVSEIKAKDHNYYRKPYFLNSNVKSTNLGTLYHRVFELLPVMKYNINSLKEEIDNLNISDEEKKLLDLEKIFAYLTSNLYDIILNCDKVYKERQIVFNIDAKNYDKSLENGKILVDGTIDLLSIKNDKYIIVDYKTDKVDDINDLVHLYKVQLDLYEMAIKEKYNTSDVDKYIYSVYLNKYIKI